jgi:hypothetical protein
VLAIAYTVHRPSSSDMIEFYMLNDTWLDLTGHGTPIESEVKVQQLHTKTGQLRKSGDKILRE